MTLPAPDTGGADTGTSLDAQSAIALLTRAGAIGAGFALTVAVIHILDPISAGRFFVVYVLVAAGAVLARLGTDTLALKGIGGGAYVRPDFIHSIALAVLIGIPAAGLLLIAGTLGLFPVSPAAGFAVSAVVAQGASCVAGAVLRARGRFALGILAELGAAPALATALVIGWAAFSPPALNGALLALGIGSWVTALWAVPVAARALVARPMGLDARGLIAANARSLLPMTATAVAGFVVPWAPVVALAIHGRFAEVALFTAAARLANFVTLVPNVQISLLAPRFATEFQAGRTDALTVIARTWARRALLIAAIPVLGLLLFAEQTMQFFYGLDSVSGAATLRILAVGALLLVALGQVTTLLLVCGRERSSAVAGVVLLVVWATAGVGLSGVVGVAAIAGFTVAVGVIHAVVGAIVLRRVGIGSTIHGDPRQGPGVVPAA